VHKNQTELCINFEAKEFQWKLNQCCYLLVQVVQSYFIFLLFISWGGLRSSPLCMSATIWPVVPAPDDDDDEFGAVAGMRIGKENRNIGRKPAPLPLSPPQIPHDLIWLQTWDVMAGNQRLTAWAIARPVAHHC
jgi:hypothetical protein